ncbi:hypothetical protein MMC12_002547 [Toensbergia leucococca]|nr:hypothetical protein [Toensbergia leucococca]
MAGGQAKGDSVEAPSISTAPLSVLEVDDRPTNRDDEESDIASLSITSSIRDYEFENGRRYHAYKAGSYAWPNDEAELDRLDLQHHINVLLCNGNLHLAPLDEPKKVLDIGTGTGIWVMEFAEKYPESTVIGTDLSPVQPEWVHDNVRFEIDDVESKWTYGLNSFDYIHSRYMIGSISKWKSYIRKAFKHCKPGGYFEIQELDPRFLCDDESLKTEAVQNSWSKMMCEASAEYNRPVPLHTDYKAWMEEAGFVDVKEYFLKLPTNDWPKNKQLKEIGKFQLAHLTEGLFSLTIGLFTRVLHWSAAEVQVLLAKMRAEVKDRRIHSYEIVAVLYGRKPESSVSSIPQRSSTNTPDVVSSLSVERKTSDRSEGSTPQEVADEQPVNKIFFSSSPASDLPSTTTKLANGQALSQQEGSLNGACNG